MKVDWNALAKELDIEDIYVGGDGYRAIVSILGEEFFEQAVENTINLRDSWMLSEGVLKILAPLGMKHCYKIYKTSDDLEARRSATYFMKYLGDKGVLKYLPEFLADPDERIQGNVIEIIDQMCFKRKIDDEDIIPILQSALEHPNERVRKFAIGTIHEQTVQGIAKFGEELEDALWGELWQWEKRLKFDTIHAFDLRCLPWSGQIQLSFLTNQEEFQLSEAYTEEFYNTWRLDDLPHHGDRLKDLGQWVGQEYEKSGKSLKSIDLFLQIFGSALNSSSVQERLNKFNLAEDFQITVFNTYATRSWENFYKPN
jgi:hypothetical protein